MKKIFKLFLSLSLVLTSVFGLVGCSGEPELIIDNPGVLLNINEEVA
ncbi:MAG TPA: hypothetical protein GX003_02650 [Acholeplasmataceae bacterium]|jgi:hypothetical protein|nr:hypothetical protein [Acholeplasmataceae bacterium]